MRFRSYWLPLIHRHPYVLSLTLSSPDPCQINVTVTHEHKRQEKVDAYIIFCEILQRALPLWEHESPAEELAVVPPSLHQHAVSDPCREPAQRPIRQNSQTVTPGVFVAVHSPSSYAKFFVGSENSFLSYFALIHCSLNTLNTEGSAGSHSIHKKTPANNNYTLWEKKKHQRHSTSERNTRKQEYGYIKLNSNMWHPHI